ncbi:LCP family protein [Actinomycetospora corticicola]|uniref:LCP family protein required for cell wall assembly n=1 Tax=Actinomycetospora corticicola TaxID=663602 RepID=A0A7Y9E0E4_9PSEU|nr:LCP family protein required for cell wall assembly [Actinomycetospora corticicola]
MSGTTNGRRRVRLAARTVVVAVSLAVLAVSAFAWVQVQYLDRSTASASVIQPSVPRAPTAEQNILLLGVDSRTDPQGNPLPADLLAALHAGGSDDGGDTADSITVVHIPAGGGRATAISIPRDSYVQLADGYGKHKVNSAYSRAVAFTTESLTEGSAGGSATSPFAPETSAAASPDDPAVRRAALEAGARTTIATVQALTGLPITHYASVNLAGFADVSQALGGVPVCLRAPVDDPYSGLRLPAGPQEVSGAEALAFVRQRHGLPGGDLDRITRQQTFLASATRELLSAGTLANPFTLDRLSAVLGRSVTLDADWNVLSFAGQLQGLSAGAVTFRTIPTGDTELATPSDGTAVEVDPVQVRQFVADAVAVDSGRPLPVPQPVGWSDAAREHAAVSGDDATESEAVPTTGAAPAPAPVTPPITAAAPGCIN